MDEDIIDLTKIQYPIVEVLWFDAQSSLDPISLEDLDDSKIILTKSVGYLMKNDSKKVIISGMIFGEHLLKHYQIIPKRMVKRIKVIRK